MKTPKTTMAHKPEISKVEIKVGGQVISLTLAEARELRDALNSAFAPSPVAYSGPLPNRVQWSPPMNRPLAPIEPRIDLPPFERPGGPKIVCAGSALSMS